LSADDEKVGWLPAQPRQSPGRRQAASPQHTTQEPAASTAMLWCLGEATLIHSTRARADNDA
jgi:hypothetical protein